MEKEIITDEITNVNTDISSGTVEPKKTTRGRKSNTGTEKKTRTVDDVMPNERVSIDNLVDWNVGFISEETGKDIQIKGGVKNYKRLTVAEVDSQVKTGNVAFCGTDDLGSHAVFRINDPIIRQYVFGEDIDPVQITQKAVEALLETSDKKSFENALSNLVVTKSEKRMIVRICKKIGIDNVPSYKIAAIEKVSGIKFS